MRTVAFVECMEFEYQGNIFSKAITVADVDNDNSNELVIGNVHGDLYIYKGSDTRPWARAADLGMITCLEAGDVCNHGMNYLVSVSTEGWCHVFSIRPDLPAYSSSDSPDVIDPDKLLRPIHKQRLPGNSKVFVIADIDGDGQNELLIGYSDRMVRAYRWCDNMVCGGLAPLVASQSVTMATQSTSATVTCQATGKFVLTEKWQLAGQVGAMSVNRGCDGQLGVMVSQPGGTFVTLLCTNSRTCTITRQDGATADEQVLKEPSLLYHPLGSARARNPTVATEVVGGISRQRKAKECLVPCYSAICTLDGTLTLVDDDRILWSLYVDHQLFALNKLDVTGDGMEEVVACSWDGQTYIVNLSKEVVRYHFRENVAAFCAGMYAVEKDRNVPCLFYATFNNKIHVYHNIRMPHIGSNTLTATVASNEGVPDLLQRLNCDPDKPAQVRQLYRWLLYGQHQKTS